MKRDLFTVTAIAFLLLWMSNSPSFSRQNEPALPSLAETEEFINKHGVTSQETYHYSTKEFKGRFVRWFFRFEVMNCKATKTQHSVANDSDGGRQVKSGPTTYAEMSDLLFYSKLVKYAMQGGSMRMTPEYRLDLIGESFWSPITVGYFDEVMGPRMKKAIDHWLDLCNGGPEPF